MKKLMMTLMMLGLLIAARVSANEVVVDLTALTKTEPMLRSTTYLDSNFPTDDNQIVIEEELTNFLVEPTGTTFVKIKITIPKLVYKGVIAKKRVEPLYTNGKYFYLFRYSWSAEGVKVNIRKMKLKSSNFFRPERKNVVLSWETTIESANGGSNYKVYPIEGVNWNVIASESELIVTFYDCVD